MSAQTPSAEAESLPAPAGERRGRHVRRRGLATGAALATVCVLAVACGGGEDAGTQATPTAVQVTVPDLAAEATAEFEASRVGVGIAESGGSVRAGDPCPAPGEPAAADTVKVAMVTPDVFDLEIIGLGDLVYDSPGLVIDAYINKVNGFGGLNGNCFEFVYHVYGFSDPAADLGRICGDLAQQDPLVIFSLGQNQAITQCATLGAQIPTIGLYGHAAGAVFEQAGGLLFSDHGSFEHLLHNGLNAAIDAGVLTGADSVALLHQENVSAEAETAIFDGISERRGLPVAGAVAVPAAFSGTPVLVVEQMFREAGGEIFDPDQNAFDAALAAMPADLAGLLGQMRLFFLGTADQLRDAGVTAVMGSTDWADVRNLMRAAELSGWRPKWVISDYQYSFLVLTDAPKEQGLNLVQVSSRRATDDPIEGLDRGCLSLRNAETDAEPFSHRYHTDAWSLMTSMCDYLDIVFAAISRVSGPLTKEALVAALGDTRYTAAHGQSIWLTPNDKFGSDGFRVLSADPDCVLNEWGCMRPMGGWQPATLTGGGSG